MILALVLAKVSSAAIGQWSRRAYYDDLECNGNFIAGINVASLGTCLQTTPLISTCVFKSRVENGITSSESSGCAPVSQITDATWIPTESDGKLVSGANYMVINQYMNVDCASSSIYEQDIFLADGKCHAIEFHKSFYKASCPTTPGEQYQFTVCDDPACTQCTSESKLDAGIYVQKSFNVPFGGSKCSQRIDSQPINVFCTVLSEAVRNSTTGDVTGSNTKATNSGLLSSLDFCLALFAIFFAAV